MENNTLYYCHTSCALLNAGPVESYLRDVTSWIRTHPYDVVTILIGNGDFVDVGNYTHPIENSGLSKYAYIPPETPLSANDWPTLSELILTGKRAVIFMDYKANQTAVPYILDEFSHMWETPFSPTDRAFPCTVDRPPGINDSVAGEMLYVANHNLNVEINFAGNSILVPNTVLLNETNNVTGYGSLGLMANHCAGKSLFAPLPVPLPLARPLVVVDQPNRPPPSRDAHVLTDNSEPRSRLASTPDLPPRRRLQRRQRLRLRGRGPAEQRHLHAFLLRSCAFCRFGPVGIVATNVSRFGGFGIGRLGVWVGGLRWGWSFKASMA